MSRCWYLVEGRGRKSSFLGGKGLDPDVEDQRQGQEVFWKSNRRKKQRG